MKTLIRYGAYPLSAGGAAIALWAMAQAGVAYWPLFPLLVSLACPLSMAGMMFGASKLGKNKKDSSLATPQISSANSKVGVGASEVDLPNSLRDANLADLRARIDELERAEPKTQA